jgi:GDPmannose 4,6-dehydratase
VAKRALIIGSAGQDGKLLQQLLTSKTYDVYGVSSSLSNSEKNLQFNLATDTFDALNNFILQIKPDEIYYLAAFHHSSQQQKENDITFINTTFQVNHLAFVNVLECCRVHLPKCRIVYTSSSLIFSGAKTQIQSEETPFEPRCFYSLSKCAAMEAAKFYRQEHNLFVSIGIMYNHESVYRKDYFLSKKIVNETRKINKGEQEKIVIGNLSSITDWGYAPDYVNALWHTLQLNSSDVFIISSCNGHKVEDWFKTLSKHLNTDILKLVEENKQLVTREKPVLIGDNRKLLASGWRPQVTFEEMVIRMYEEKI